MLATILVALFTAVVSGAVPALRASRLSPGDGSEGRSAEYFGRAAQVAPHVRTCGRRRLRCRCLLLTCAGLFVRSLDKAQKADPGFDPNNVLLADLRPATRWVTPTKPGMEFQRQVSRGCGSLPGVQSATLADFSPLSFTIHSEGVLPEGYVPRVHENIEADRGDGGTELS